jgi:hypothetical protein
VQNSIQLLLAFSDDGADAVVFELDDRLVSRGNSGSGVWGFEVWHLVIIYEWH